MAHHGPALGRDGPSWEAALNDETVHITRWGESGPRLVLIHGGVQGGLVGGDRLFATQQRLTERGWQLIVPDRPGHGRSPDPGRPDDAAADGRWVADLLEDGAHLVGHSFGGCVALDAATRRPAATRSLTLIEPAMQNLATSDPRVRRFGLRAARVLFLSLSARARILGFARLVGIPPDIRGDSSPEELRRMGKALRRLVLPKKATLERQLDELRDRKIPLLVVTGGWNPAFEAVGDSVAKRGGGERLVIRSEHHFPHLASDEFNAALARFIAARVSEA